MSWNIVSLNEKLSFSPMYFALSVYILVIFASSCLYPWLLGVLLFGRGWRELFIDTLPTELVGLMIESMRRGTIRGISFGESIIGVFISLKLIWYESNVPSDNRYSWISVSVHYMDFSSCKTLNKDLAIVVLDFSIQTLGFRRNL